MLVKAVDRDEVLYPHNATKLMMPASTMKVVTLAAAAEKLGWDYTLHDPCVHHRKDQRAGSSTAISSSSDPAIRASTTGMARRRSCSPSGPRSSRPRAFIRSAAESSATTTCSTTTDSGSDGRGTTWPRSFSASVSALQFNEGSVQLKIAPGRSIGSRAAITVVPDFSGLAIDNRLTTDAAGGSPAVVRRRLPGSSRLEIRGSLPLRTRPFSETASVENPTLYFVTALRRALVAGGIEVHGPAVDIDDLDSPPTHNASVPLITYQSPPLSMLATTMMKLSQNLYAETLLKTIGIDSIDHPTGTAQAGLAVIRSVLEGWNIDPAGMIQADGSGLSRYNYITPETMVAILTHIGRDPRLKSVFEATLPVAGRDGTLENRMRGTAADGNARIKTGSLTNVRAMAGYVRTADGDTLAFTLIANNFENSSNVITAAFDSIVERLASFHGR